jgi:hypothetical protein
MRLYSLFRILLALSVIMLVSQAQAQQVTRPAGAKKAANGYHRTSNTKAKPRSGAYSRYSRAGRRDEEAMKLAPGLRLNMPSPPTTDYLGRPLKKKAPKVAAASATSLSSEKAAPVKAAPATVRKARKR